MMDSAELGTANYQSTSSATSSMKKISVRSVNDFFQREQQWKQKREMQLLKKKAEEEEQVSLE